MDLQRATVGILIVIGGWMLATGCTPDGSAEREQPAYRLVASSQQSELSGVRVYASAHYVLCTSLYDPSRIGPIIATLESAYEQYVAATGVHPPPGSPAMNVYVFQTRAEWAAFTRRRTGPYASIYLKLDRGGYTYDKVTVVREQGEHDTLTVLAHEGLHLFIATYFKARPPPFLEEGLACQFETVRLTDAGGARIEVGQNAARSSRLASLLASGEPLTPLRAMLSMHAGNIVGLPGAQVDAFYAQAWAFVRFLRDSDDPALREAFARLMADAASAALSSDSLADDPALVERYLGQRLEAIDPAYRAFVAGNLVR